MNPLIADILTQHYPNGRWDAEKAPPTRLFEDDESIRLQGGDPGRTPRSECRHDWFALPGRPCWFRCPHCGTVEHLVD